MGIKTRKTKPLALVPEGWHPATIVDIRDVGLQGSKFHKEQRHFLEFTFLIEIPGYSPVRITKQENNVISERGPYSRPSGYFTLLHDGLGLTIADDEEFDSDTARNRKLQVRIAHVEKWNNGKKCKFANVTGYGRENMQTIPVTVVKEESVVTAMRRAGKHTGRRRIR
jgi:hypothetical protein